ncbi:MAG: Uma2 family endonuclease [Cyanobacteria bacterium J06639_1]
MLQLDPSTLPSSLELPDSDDTPVDNEDQNFVPNVLLFVLEYLWRTRDDWYFGVDMGIYHLAEDNPRTPIIPDGFLSLGVERRKKGRSRRSYVMWEEDYISPSLVLEVVSVTRGNEYDEKLSTYEKLGVLYYVIYNPEFWKRDKHDPFEVYKLERGTYQLHSGEPYWMPEIGLGIGRNTQSSDPYRREILSWYDERGMAYPTAQEQLVAERNRVQAERERAEMAERQVQDERERTEAAQKRADVLADYLRSQGIDPDSLPGGNESDRQF